MPDDCWFVFDDQLPDDIQFSCAEPVIPCESDVIDEELRKGLEISWQRNRAIRLVPGRAISPHDCPPIVTTGVEMWRARQDSNLRPSAPEADALSS